MSEVAAVEILSEYVPAIMEWCETYMRKEPATGSGEIEFKRYMFMCTHLVMLKATDICTLTSHQAR